MTSIRAISSAACSLALAGYVGIGLIWADFGAKAEQQFADVLDRRADASSVAAAATGAADAPASLHLSALTTSPGSDIFTKGSVITFTTPQAGSLTYAVVNVQEIALPADPAARQGRLLLVTVQATGGVGQPASTLRFIVDAEGAAPTLPLGLQTKPHAL